MAKQTGKLTINDLESLLINNSNGWSWDITETDSNFEKHSFYEPDGIETVRFDSYVAGYCVASYKKEYSIGFAWVAIGGTETYQLAHEFEINIDENTKFEIDGFDFIDDDGDNLWVSDINSELYDLLSTREWCNKVYDLLPISENEEIDNEVVTDMNEYEVIRDNDRNIKFNGELLASVGSSWNNASGSSYSGSVGRCTGLKLYKTSGGKFICSRIEHTQWQGERNEFYGAVCETIDEVITFFGTGWIAKELYEEADIDACEVIA